MEYTPTNSYEEVTRVTDEAGESFNKRVDDNFRKVFVCFVDPAEAEQCDSCQ